MRVRGTSCQCFLDEREILQFDETRNTRGAVGFQTCFTSARFRSIRVTDPTGKVLLDRLPELPGSADWSFPSPPSPSQLHCLKGHGAPVVSLAFSHDGSQLLSSSNGEFSSYTDPKRPVRVGGPGCTVRLWDVATGKELDCSRPGQSPRENSCVFGLAQLPGSTAFVSTRNELSSLTATSTQQLRLWEIAANKLQTRLLFPQQLTGLQGWRCTADGRRLLALTNSGSIWEWDLNTKQLLRQTPVGMKDVVGVAIAADGRSALLTRQVQPVAVIDLATGKETRRWPAEAKPVQSPLLFYSDDRKVISGGADGSVYLWDAATGKQLERFTSHKGQVHALALSSAHRRALSGGADGTVRLWDLEGKKELTCFTGHTHEVRSVAFSPDGRWAASGGNDYTVRLWRLPPESEMSK